MQEKDDTTPRVKSISKEETKQDQHFGKSTSKIQLMRWTKPSCAWKFSNEAECWLEAFAESRLQ